MPNALNDQQIQNARYWYEKIPYTFNGNFISGQNAPMFQVNNVGSASQNSKIAILSDLATDRVANFSLVVNLAGTSRIMATDAFPANLSPVLTRVGSGFRSSGFMNMTVQNNTGAVVAGYQTNYACAVKQLTTAEKILHNLPLTSRDKLLSSKYDLGSRGLRPISLETSLERAFWSQVIDEQVYAFEQTAVAGLSTPVINEQTQHGEVLIITSIGLSATAGNGVNLNIDRDQNYGHVSILADNMSINDRFDVWIPVNERFSATLSATTTTPNVQVLLTVLRVRRTLLVDILFGQVNPAMLTGRDAQMYEEIEAGVLL